MAKIMEIISKETGGKSYNTEKYSYDTIGCHHLTTMTMAKNL